MFCQSISRFLYDSYDMINPSKGAVQILVLPQSMTWKINVFAHTVIIQDTQWYNGRAHTYADYAVTDVLRMMGRAGRITLDEEGKCIVLCQSSKKEFFKKVYFLVNHF